MMSIVESLRPAGSLPPPSLVPPRARLKVTLEPVWPTIRKIRQQLREALEGFPANVRDAAMMAASELTENAIKYGESVASSMTISFKFERYDEQIRIEVSNGCTNLTAVHELFECIEQIAEAPDKEALYFARVQRMLENPQESGKLGLHRIALEGQFTLYSRYENEVVTVAATRNIP
jgi:anti-sigma regulatory factor (Ser/Thr protein kinase)